MRFIRLRRTGLFFAIALLTACTGEDNQPPVADGAELTTLEDQSVTGQLTGSDPEGAPLMFLITSRNRAVSARYPAMVRSRSSPKQISTGSQASCFP